MLHVRVENKAYLVANKMLIGSLILIKLVIYKVCTVYTVYN